MKQPNEVPEGAEYWCEGSDSWMPAWFHKDDGEWFYMLPSCHPEATGKWVKTTIIPPVLSMVNRPDHSVDATDMVNKPPHYQLREGYEVYDLRQDLAAKAQAANVPHDQYSDWDRALEYLIRCWDKNGLEDVRKSRWYLNKLIEKLELDENGVGK